MKAKNELIENAKNKAFANPVGIFVAHTLSLIKLKFDIEAGAIVSIGGSIDASRVCRELYVKPLESP